MSQHITSGSKKQEAAAGSVGLPYAAMDFRSKHIRSAALAAAAEGAGEPWRALKYATCGTSLGFGLDDTGRHLTAANFCGQRLCPICTARRAKKTARRLASVLRLAQQQREGIRFLFLTLTMRNVSPEGLPDALQQLLAAWRRLMRFAALDDACEGWFRALEVTRNRNAEPGQTYHPHIHALLAVPAEYFDPARDLYLTHGDLVRLWRRALRVDYLPSVQISVIYGDGKHRRGAVDTAAAVAEAAKYAAKDSDIIGPDCNGKLAEAAGVWQTMFDALYGRRLTAFGGLLRKVARELGLEDIETGDTIDADEATEQSEADLLAYELYEWWTWDGCVTDYVCREQYTRDIST